MPTPIYDSYDFRKVNQVVNTRIHNVSTSERTTLSASLGTDNTGMFVYDTTDGQFYVWDGSAWDLITTGTIVSGVSSVNGTANEITVSPTTGATVVSLPSSLTFTGKTVTGGTFQDLAGLTVDGNTTLGDSLADAVTITGRVGVGAISSTDLFNTTLGITGGIAASGYSSNSNIASDVTSLGVGFNTTIGTDAASFTLFRLSHFRASQGTIGAGSSVTNQNGFFVSSTLIDATNNYGLYSEIASGTNRWNIYSIGTANNLMAGSLAIGATTPTSENLYLSKNITGAATSFAYRANANIQSDVTTLAAGVHISLNTAAASFTLAELRNYHASGGTTGSGSTITSQYGYFAQSNLTNATNNYAYYGNVYSGTNRWNFFANGTANNAFAGNSRFGSTTAPVATVDITGTLATTGNVGIGGSAPLDYSLKVVGNLTGTILSYGVGSNGVIQSDVTTEGRYFDAGVSTVAAAFTCANARCYVAKTTSIGAGSSITNQVGYYVEHSLVGATNNYGVLSNIASGTGRWNVYSSGTAENYYAGNSRFANGSASLPSITNLTDIDTGIYFSTANEMYVSTGGIQSFVFSSSPLLGLARISRTITGSATAVGYNIDGVIQSDVSDARLYVASLGTQATSFTLGHARYFFAVQGAIGATSAVTSQYGFQSSSGLTGAINNYSHYGSIAAGTGRWNFFANGTANNAYAGLSRFGATTVPLNTVDITGSLGRGAPVTKTANFTLAATENWLINNKAGSTCTVTLPAASSWTGREVMIQNYQAFTVVSASSNVVPLGGGAAGTAILPATIGSWCTLVSDGTNWVIMQS